MKFCEFKSGCTGLLCWVFETSDYVPLCLFERKAQEIEQEFYRRYWILNIDRTKIEFNSINITEIN